MIGTAASRDERLHERLRLAALTIAPAAALLAFRTFAPVASPRAAEAARPALVQPFALPPIAPRTPAQAELARVIDEQLARGIGPSPLAVIGGPESPAPASPDAGVLRAPTSTLTSVLTGPSGTLAVLGGKLCSVGVEVEPGWTLESIDAVAGRVTLLHGSGLRRDLSIRPPGGK